MSANSTTLKDLIARGVESVRAVAAQAGTSLPDDAAFVIQLETVIAGSDYLTEVMSQHPEWVAELWGSGDLVKPSAIETQREYLRRMLDIADDAGLDRALRLFRHREMLRILWRDLNDLADLDATLDDLSAMAHLCLSEAVERLYAQACVRWGTPRDAEGNAQSLVVLGMGKLGAGELNVSSDVDLIFAYPVEGETDGRRPLSNETFFRRLGQRLIHTIGEPTADGFVFRVDMRLRPHGEGGRLALSFAATEEYYQREGRDWERYALIKARPVAGNLEAGDQLLTTLKPFVYRRYLDYSAFEALRDMKALVNAEVRRKGLEDNIKLGRGGIREIEFVVQAFQLIHAGKDPEFEIITNSIGNTGLAPVHLGLVKKCVTSFAGESYPTPGPSKVVNRALEKGLELENWSMLTIPQRLLGGCMGVPWFPTRSLAGSSIGAELKEH